MNLSQLLFEMCHNVLSAADMKAIAKNRGFAAAAVNAPAQFATAFISPTGVAAAMSTLSPAEIAALHMLRQQNRVVDVTFFERLYGSKQVGIRAYGTFTQQFKPIFDAVQRGFIRKGLLIITEAKTTAQSKTKMELWRYYFPPDFAEMLPPLITDSTHTTESGTLHPDRFRQALYGLLDNAAPDHPHVAGVEIRDGNLLVAKQQFTTAALHAWRQAAWEAAIFATATQAERMRVLYDLMEIYQGFMLPTDAYSQPSTMPFLLDAFAQLAADEWLAADALDTLLNLVYNGARHPTSATICHLGWETGMLARYRATGHDYFRLATARGGADADPPASYLALDGDTIWVDLKRIAYTALEQLGHIATLRVVDKRLQARLDITKIVAVREAMSAYECADYLKANSAAFRAILKKLDAQWGKLIVHDNLLVARITDLSLRVKLQKAFDPAADASAPQLVMLAGEYVAFPRAMLAEVERVVKKSGHVVKVVQAKS